jgi:hypothetical protein
MTGIKLYVPRELEEEFRKRAMEAFGYGRGSISKAGREAIQRWASERERSMEDFPPPANPVKDLRGMLKHVEKSSVELQHEAKILRAGKRE